MHPSLQKVRVERKTYWQLAAIILFLLSAFVIWKTIQDKNKSFTMELSSERSLFTGFMYHIEYDKEIDGKKNDLYRISTPTGNFEKAISEQDDRHELSRIEREIHTMVKYEDQIVLSGIMLLYIWLCWLVLRKYPWERNIRLLPLVFTVYFLFSIWQKWSDLRESAEDVLRYLTRL